MAIDVCAEVIANTPLSSDYHVLQLAAPAIAHAVEPGQFVMVRMSGSRDPLLRRPFSVFQTLRDGAGAPIGITVFSKRIGPSTRLLYDARPGQHVDCLGPLGTPWTRTAFAAHDRPAYLVAGGVGLAAFAIFAEWLAQRGVATTLFYGARTGAELFALEVFRATGAAMVLTTEDGSVGEQGRVTGPLTLALADATSRPVVYACGPEGMMKAVTAIAGRAGAPCYVSMERIMGCGLGGCYSCVVPMRTEAGGAHHVRSCLAGPVMDGHSIVWDVPGHPGTS